MAIWENLKDVLIDELDQLKDKKVSEDVVVCLNIHNNGRKVKASKLDKSTTDTVWKKWQSEAMELQKRQTFKEKNKMFNTEI